MSDKSSAENEARKSDAPKKLELSVPKDKENRWQFVDNATEAAFSKQFVPKIPLQEPNGPCRTLLLGEMGETLEIKPMTHFWEIN